MAAVVFAMMEGEPNEVLTTSIANSNSTLALTGPIFNLTSLTSDGDKTDYSSEGIKFDAVTTAGLISDSGVIGVETSQGLVLSVGDSITVGQVTLAGTTNTLDLQNTVYLPAHFLNADGSQLFEVQGDTTGDGCHGLATVSPPQLHTNLSDTSPVVSSHSDTGHELKKRKGGWPKGRKRKKEKQFQGPKAPASAYVIFAIERRRQIKEMTPELPFVEVTKLLGGEWSAMCPEEKQKYIDMAERDKQRYIDELKLYQQSEPYQNFLKRKRALCEEDSPNLDIIDTSHYLDNIEEEEGLYCKVCDQYFSNMHNRKEHLFGKQHLQNVTTEFEKEMEKQDETDTLTCDDLSQDMLSVSSDHTLLGSATASFVVGTSEPLDINRFIHQFMQKNLEREFEMGHLRKMADVVRQQNMALVNKIKQLQQIQGKLEQELSTTKGISAALSAQLDALRMVPTLFGVINF